MESEESSEQETDADTGLKRWIRQGDHEKELIADPDTRLESALTCTGCLGLFLIIPGCQVALEHGSTAGGPVMGVGALMGVLGLVLRSKLDDHYRIDFQARTVTFYRKFVSKVTRRPVCDFSRLHCLAIDGEQKTAKNKPSWWEYGLILVLKDGKIVRLTDVDEKDFSLAEERAKVLSVMLETPLHPPQEKITYEVHQGPGGLTLQEKKEKMSTLACAFLVIFTAVTIGIFFANS